MVIQVGRMIRHLQHKELCDHGTEEEKRGHVTDGPRAGNPPVDLERPQEPGDRDTPQDQRKDRRSAPRQHDEEAPGVERRPTPQSRHRGRIHPGAAELTGPVRARCRSTSYSTTAVATEALRLCTLPWSGMRTRPSPRRCPPRLGAVRTRPADPGPRAPRRPRARGGPWPAAESPRPRDPDGPPAGRSGGPLRPSPGALRAPDARRRAGRSKPRGSSLPAGRAVGPILEYDALCGKGLPDLIRPRKVFSEPGIVSLGNLALDLRIIERSPDRLPELPFPRGHLEEPQHRTIVLDRRERLLRNYRRETGREFRVELASKRLQRGERGRRVEVVIHGTLEVRRHGLERASNFLVGGPLRHRNLF